MANELPVKICTSTPAEAPSSPASPSMSYKVKFLRVAGVTPRGITILIIKIYFSQFDFHLNGLHSKTIGSDADGNCPDNADQRHMINA